MDDYLHGYFNLASPAAPEKPSGPIKFSNILGDSVTLTWSPPKKDGGAPIQSYKVELSEDNGKTWKQVENIDSTKYTVTGLKSGDKYKFRVAAVNELGDGEALLSEAVVPQRPTSELLLSSQGPTGKLF